MLKILSHLSDFVSVLPRALKLLVATYQQLLKLVLRLIFNLILLSKDRVFQKSIQQLIKEIIKGDAKWLIEEVEEDELEEVGEGIQKSSENDSTKR